MRKYDNLRHELSLLLMLQVLLGGCGDDDPTDEWVGTWTLEIWNGDKYPEESVKIYKDSMYENFIQGGATRELINRVIDVEGIEMISEITFDNNSRWGLITERKMSATKKALEFKNHPDKEVREFAAGLMELIKDENGLVNSATGSYIVTEDEFTMMGDSKNEVFSGRMSGIWNRSGSKLNPIGDNDSGLGTIIFSK